MRITFVCPTADLSGGFRVIATYAKLLRQRGHDVVVVTGQPPKLSVRAMLRQLSEFRLPTVSLKAMTHLDGLGVPHKILGQLGGKGAMDLPEGDIVIATWWETAEWVWPLPVEKGVKVHFCQDYEVWNGNADRVDATCRLPMPKITPSRWVQQLLTDRFEQTDVVCIPNAVDLKTFTATPRGKQDIPTVGFTYTDFRAKGCDIIVEAVRRARTHIPNLRVVSFGSSEPKLEMPLPEGVEFHLRAPEAKLKAYYASCDAWLFGTRKEGFGLPLLEAMACRTPVIGTPAGAAPELLERGGGILIPPEDPAAMVDAILRVRAMTDADWRRMSDAAYLTASGYTWEDATEQFEAALLRAFARGNTRR